MKYFLSVALFILSTFHAFSQADISIAYDSGTNLHLGGNSDCDHIFDAKPDCLSSSEKEWVDGGAISTKVSTLFISDHNDISKNFKLSLHSDIKSSINFAGAISGGGSSEIDFTMKDEFKDVSNSIYFVVKAETSHGRLKLKDYSLKTEFKALLDAGKYEEFVSICGTHYVRFETRISAVCAIIKINNIESEVKKEILSKYAASANVKSTDLGSVEGKTKLDIDNLFKEISKYGKVEISYLAQGSEGIKSFSPLVSSSGSYQINLILQNLATALADFDKEKSAPVEYKLASFKPFGLKNYTLHKDKLIYLEKTQANTNVLYDSYNKLQKIKEDRPTDFELYYKPFEVEITKKIVINIERLKECYNNNVFDISKIADDRYFLSTIKWPSNIFDGIKFDYIPSYSEFIDSKGRKKQVLTSLIIAINGRLLHSNFYSSMMPLMFTDGIVLTQTNGYTVGENNPSLGPPTENNKIKSIPFLLKLESFDTNINPTSNASISSNSINKAHKDLLSKLRTRKYLVSITTTDGYVYLQPVKYNFRESDINLILDTQ